LINADVHEAIDRGEDAEVAHFEAHPHYRDAVQLRRWTKTRNPRAPRHRRLSISGNMSRRR
jgi:hypothetical protein